MLAALTVFALWQRETIYYILHPNKIQIKSADEIKTALLSGEYGAVEDRAGVLRYRVLDGSVEVGVTLDNTLLRLDAAFNAYGIPVGGVPDALRKARFVLSPYLSAPEVKALSVLISTELPGLVTSAGIEYSRGVGGHTVFVAGSMDTGDMVVTVTQNTLSGGSP